MKLVKSLLLGSAAGLMAVTGSMAADLPSRKAAPADYVRVCSAQGVGFFFIPGTENCLQISGRVRADYQFGRNYSRADDQYGIRASARLNFDYRQATSIGTVRAYVRFNMGRSSGRTAFGYTGNGIRQTNDGANTPATLDLAFIQFGLGGGAVTAGRATSFFDFYGTDAYWNFGGISGTNGAAANLLAYTANFGGGFSATLALEDRGVAGLTNAVAAPAVPNLLYSGRQYPDIVGVLRLQQGWGTAQLMAAVRDVRVDNATATALSTVRGSKTGYAIGAGASFNLPMLGAGSGLYVEGVYSKGMSNYISPDSTSRIGYANLAFADYAYNSVTGRARLVEAYSLVAALRLQYTPQLRQNIFAGYTSVSYGSFSGIAGALPTLNSTTGLRSFNKFEIGTNFQYTIAPGLNLGVEVVYSNIDPRGTFTYTTAGGVAAVANSQSAVEGRLRIQRDF
jgi:hypothetical protein